MHKNAIKIVCGVKNCALFTKNMAPFGEKKFVHLFVRFLAKLGALLKSKHFEALLSSAISQASSKLQNNNLAKKLKLEQLEVIITKK